MTLSLLWYAVDARKWFKGPKINVEHLIHTKVIEGENGEQITLGPGGMVEPKKEY